MLACDRSTGCEAQGGWGAVQYRVVLCVCAGVPFDYEPFCDGGGGGTVQVGAVPWPLQDIPITNIVWCMAYKRGVGGASYIAP